MVGLPFVADTKTTSGVDRESATKKLKTSEADSHSAERATGREFALSTAASASHVLFGVVGSEGGVSGLEGVAR